MSKEIYIQEKDCHSYSCLEYHSNEKVIERVNYFLTHCKNGMLAITIKTPKETTEEGVNNDEN